MELVDHHPLKEKHASFGRDKTTGTFFRAPVEAEWLKADKSLKAEFDRVDSLSEEDLLREYGHTVEDNDGALVRVKASGRVVDRWRPDGNGDFLYDRVEYTATGIQWVPTVCTILTDPVTKMQTPSYEWPREHIRLVFGHALKHRAARAAGVPIE